jgi:hypothetical protein
MSDNQSDNSEQWNTPAATPTVAVNLTNEEWSCLIAAYIKQDLSPETYETFQASLAEGKTEAEAVFDAIRNEAANVALQEELINQSLTQLAAALDGVTGRSNARERIAAIFNDVEEQMAMEPVRMVWVTFRKEGIHLYPAAATDPKLKTGGWDDVSFLGVPHRHIFHFRVSMEVFHDDRDVEFIQLKRWCERLYSEGTLELNHKSCEMLSDDLQAKLTERWPGRTITIEVSEDGENGSYTAYPA